MTQKSWPWSTVAALGDGAAELNEALSREFLSVYFAVQNPAVEGVSKGVLGELAVSGTATPLTVQAGSGICYGLFISDGVETLAVTTPAVGTTGGRVVMQTNWAGTGGGSLEARTRLVAKKNSDGNSAPPALVQTVGVTWEISLATFTITTGGVITVTDARTFRKSTMVAGSGELSADSVTNAILRNSAAVSVIGRAANSSGDPADIAAGANDRLLARVADALSWVQLTIGMIPDAIITGAKLVANTVSFSKIARITGPAVLGRSDASVADLSAIAPDGSDTDMALTVSGTVPNRVVGFSQVITAMLASLAVTTAKLADQAVTFAKLGPGAALSVWGQSSNLSGTIDNIQAGTDGHVLRRFGTTLGFGTVATAGLAANSVDDTIAGDRVPQLYRRQGGSSTSWASTGAINYVPTTVRIQCGSIQLGGPGSVLVTFPVAFSQIPLVFVTPTGSAEEGSAAGTATTTQVTIYGPAGGSAHWLAIGQE